MNEDDFEKKLTPEQYRVMREGGTEAPFSGELLKEKRHGVFSCAACGNELFSSDTKYESGSGWPSFYDVLSTGAVKLKEDTSLGMQRVEVQCAQCGSHLGHLFPDGPKSLPDGRQATGQRYCINSVTLHFNETDKKKGSM